MATRYLAFFGPLTANDDALTTRIDRQTDLHLTIATKAFTLFSNAAEETLIFPEKDGAIIGPLFTRSTAPQAITVLDTGMADRITKSCGSHLIDHAWGGYIAILADNGGCPVIVRDPSGAMPCYYVQTQWGWIIASDIELLSELNLIVPAVDWSFMAHHLAAFDFRTEQTGLSGVRELLAGTRLTLSGNARTTVPIWTPWDYVTPEKAQNTAPQVQQLRETILGCVRTWAGRYSRILLGVSGGLDSSVIAASLAGHADLLTLTMRTDEGEGDERTYARLLTHALRLEMIEGLHDLADIDITHSTSVHLPRPLSGAFGQSENTLKFRIARERGIHAFFSGIGGDNVFCYLRSTSPIVDRLRTEGFGSGIFRTLDDVCQLTGCTSVEALRMAWKQMCAGSPAYHWAPNCQFLAPQLATTAPTFRHPWLDAPRRALPGKIAHVSMLLRIQGTIDGFSRTLPPQINPLLSQPIMEACLAIPSWQWCRNGQNRSVVRDAFSGLLPPEIIQRRSKGGPTSFAYEVIDRNQATLRGMLLDGELARAGLLDPIAIAEALPLRRPVRGADYMRLSVLAEAEAWARHWTFRPLRRPTIPSHGGGPV